MPRDTHEETEQAAAQTTNRARQQAHSMFTVIYRMLIIYRVLLNFQSWLFFIKKNGFYADDADIVNLDLRRSDYTKLTMDNPVFSQNFEFYGSWDSENEILHFNTISEYRGYSIRFTSEQVENETTRRMLDQYVDAFIEKFKEYMVFYYNIRRSGIFKALVDLKDEKMTEYEDEYEKV